MNYNKIFVFSFSSILLLIRNHSPDPSFRICHVSGIPGDDMDMQVHYPLTCRNTVVYADILPIRRIFPIQVIFCIPDQLPESNNLFFCCLKDGRDVPFWDYQQVAGGYRILVIPGICIFVVKNDVIWSVSAEDTGYRVEKISDFPSFTEWVIMPNLSR